MEMRYFTPYVKSTKDIISEMTTVEINDASRPTVDKGEIFSYGVSTVVNFAGKIAGRFVIDVEPSLAFEFAKRIMGEEYKDIKNRDVLGTILEINNTIVGDANSNINNNFNMKLKLSTPVVFAGKDVVLNIPKVEAVSQELTSSFGKMRITLSLDNS